MSNLRRLNNGVAKYNELELPYLKEGYKFVAREVNKRELYKYTRKLKELSRGEINTLFKLLYSYTELSPNNYPNDLDQNVLYRGVLNKFGNTSALEIEQAFLDAMDDKFEVETNPYGKFSFGFFAKIVNGYKEWLTRTRVVKGLEPVENKKTPEQIEQDGLDALKRNAKNILDQINKGVNLGAIWIQPSLYNILKSNNLIKPSKWIRLEEYETIQEQCAGEYMKLKPKKDILEQITEDAKRNDGMKMAVIYTIQAMIKEKANSEILEIIEGLKWVK